MLDGSLQSHQITSLGQEQSFYPNKHDSIIWQLAGPCLWLAQSFERASSKAPDAQLTTRSMDFAVDPVADLTHVPLVASKDSVVPHDTIYTEY